MCEKLLLHFRDCRQMVGKKMAQMLLCTWGWISSAQVSTKGLLLKFEIMVGEVSVVIIVYDCSSTMKRVRSSQSITFSRLRNEWDWFNSPCWFGCQGNLLHAVKSPVVLSPNENLLATLNKRLVWNCGDGLGEVHLRGLTQYEDNCTTSYGRLCLCMLNWDDHI